MTVDDFHSEGPSNSGNKKLRSPYCRRILNVFRESENTECESVFHEEFVRIVRIAVISSQNHTRYKICDGQIKLGYTVILLILSFNKI